MAQAIVSKDYQVEIPEEVRREVALTPDRPLSTLRGFLKGMNIEGVREKHWDDALGPFCGTGQVAKILGGVSRQAIADRRERRTLLGLKTAEGVMVYPTFQFDDRNQVLPGLAEILQAFRSSAVDDWTLAAWLVAPSKVLHGQSVIEWLRAGEDMEIVLKLARKFALG